MKDGVWVRGRGKRFTLEVAKDGIFEVRICGGKGGEEFLKVAEKLRALLEVGGMGFLDSIDI